MRFSKQFQTQEWDLFTYDMIKQNYQISIEELANKLQSYKGIKLSEKNKHDIWDIFKVSQAEESEPLDQRKVNVKHLVGTKLERKSKRIN